MNFTALIDVAIGLSLTFLAASLFVTIANEFIAQIVNRRSAYLRQSLDTLLQDGQIRLLTRSSPLLSAVLDDVGRKSYVDPLTVAQALVGGLRPIANRSPTVDDLIGAIRLLPDSPVKAILLAQAAAAGPDVAAFTRSLADWIDRSLQALGESYKRNTQWMSVGLGFAIAVLFNINTVTLTQRLYGDNGLRADFVAVAEQLIARTPPDAAETCLKSAPTAPDYPVSCNTLTNLATALKERREIWGRLPIGWQDWQGWRNFLTPADGLWTWSLRLVGWLLTALAISIGAPFWFDLLNKVMNVRHAMRKPEAG